MHTARSLLVPAALAALLCGLTGCSFSDGITSSTHTEPAPAHATPGAPSSASSSSSAAGSSSSADSGSNSAGLSDVPDACPVRDQVSTDLGMTVGYPAVTPADTTLGCAYSTSGDDGIGTGPAVVSINFSTVQTPTPGQEKAQLASQGTTSAFESVPGVGDAAFYDNKDGGSYLVVLSGKLSIRIVTASPALESSLSSLASDILAD